jgi:hypothetical protein
MSRSIKSAKKFDTCSNLSWVPILPLTDSHCLRAKPYIQTSVFRRGLGLLIPTEAEIHPTNHYEVSITTEHESAATDSGATDVFRLAGLIRACRLLPHCRWTPLRQGYRMWGTCRRMRPRTDEPSAAQGTSVAPNFPMLLHLESCA